MDAVLTIHDWWDGPLLGMATYGGLPCIYERIFSEETDGYLNQYYLTPVSCEQSRQIMEDWREWLQWMAYDASPEHAAQRSGRQLDLANLAKRSPDYRKYVKRAEFRGSRPRNFYSAIQDYGVIWRQP